MMVPSSFSASVVLGGVVVVLATRLVGTNVAFSQDPAKPTSRPVTCYDIRRTELPALHCAVLSSWAFAQTHRVEKPLAYWQPFFKPDKNGFCSLLDIYNALKVVGLQVEAKKISLEHVKSAGSAILSTSSPLAPESRSSSRSEPHFVCVEWVPNLLQFKAYEVEGGCVASLVSESDVERVYTGISIVMK